MSITNQKRIIEDGDEVIMWGGRDYITPLTIRKGTTTNNKRGSFPHNALIGVEFGSRVSSAYKRREDYE